MRARGYVLIVLGIMVILYGLSIWYISPLLDEVVGHPVLFGVEASIAIALAGLTWVLGGIAVVMLGGPSGAEPLAGATLALLGLLIIAVGLGIFRGDSEPDEVRALLIVILLPILTALSGICIAWLGLAVCKAARK